MNAAATINTEAPGRVAVFAQLLWRTIMLSFCGGVLVSGLFIAASLVFDEIDDEVIMWSPIIVAVGALFGLLFGVTGGALIALVGAVVLVPYRGSAFTRWFTGITMAIGLAVFFTIIGLGSGDHVVWLVAGSGATLVGALASPLLVGWYVKRMS